MTLRRLRWSLVPLLGALALVALILPPRALPERPTLLGAILGLGGGLWRQNVQQEHASAVESARDRLRGSIAARAHGSADLLGSRSAGALRSTVEPVSVVWDRDVPEAAARAWLHAAETELAAVPRGVGGGVPVVLALHNRDPRPDAIGSGWTQVAIYRYEFEGRAGRACIVDAVFPARQTRTAQGSDRFEVPGWARGGLLGRCVFYARWGFPGSEVRRWVGLGDRWSREWAWWYDELPMFGLHRVQRDTLYWRQPYGGGVPWAALGCFRGVDAYCLALSGLGSTGALGRAPSFYYYGWGYGPGADRLVADVIRERGSGHFEAFWTSSLRPDSALSLAYGVPAGHLAREALSRSYVPEPLAQPGAGDLLVAGGWVIALGIVATALAWRREMDL
jgi:hypothetical protein